MRRGRRLRPQRLSDGPCGGLCAREREGRTGVSGSQSEPSDGEQRLLFAGVTWQGSESSEEGGTANSPGPGASLDAFKRM